MSKERLSLCTHHRHIFLTRAAPGQGRPQAARATGISVVWRRLPITTVTIALVTALWIYDYLSVSAAAEPVVSRSSVAVEYVPPIPLAPLPGSHSANKPTEAARAQDAKATLSAFRRIPMNQNEVDYVAEDVTIRVFSPSVRPTRVPHLNKQLHIGKDVTVRYFEYEPSLAPQTRPDSAAAQVAERSLLLPK